MHTLDRRKFLQTSLALGAGVCLSRQMSAAGGGHRANVLEFGADPKGEADSTEAVRKAIASLAPTGARLVFPAGSYRFAASEETAMQFTGFDGIEIYANEAELFFSGNTAPFGFKDCKDVAVHDVKVDWDRPAFLQGNVMEAKGRSFTIGIDPAFPVTGTEVVTDMAEFSADTRRPALHGVNVKGIKASLELIAPQQLRITLEKELSLRPGMLLTLLHKQPRKDRETGCFLFEQCEGILIEDVNVYQAPASAFLLRGCRDLHMDNVTVASRRSRAKEVQPLLTVAGDGLNCRDCHGTFVLKQVTLEGVAGDAVNIYQSYWKITQRLDDRTVMLTGSDWETPVKWELPEAGDFVQFTSPETLALLGEIGVQSVGEKLAKSPQSSGTPLRFSETLSPVIVPGTLVCSVVDAPRVRFDHCSIGNTLGRGLVLHSRAEIVDSHFQGCAQEAILLAPDLKRMQGPAVQNVRIRTTTFEDCYLASNARRGIITVDSAQDASSAKSDGMPNSVIRIQGNTFIRTNAVAVYAADIDDLVVTENVLGRAPGSPAAPSAIELHNIANAAISSNASNVPQTVVLVNCAETVKLENNRLLTTSKQG